MHRFFLEQSRLRADGRADLASLAHQLYAVLRLRAGAEIELFDGSGMAFCVRIEELSARGGYGIVLSADEPPGEPTLHLTLYQCSLKADKFEWVLQKGTELGVSRFVPVISRRSVVRPASAMLKKYDRWRSIIREAAEQSGRTRLPELDSPSMLDDLVYDTAAARLLPWESATDQDACGINRALDDAGITSHVDLLIGPEGGLDHEEVTIAVASGWRTVSLGPRILRAETAALAASALVLSYFGDLGPR